MLWCGVGAALKFEPIPVESAVVLVYNLKDVIVYYMSSLMIKTAHCKVS